MLDILKSFALDQSCGVPTALLKCSSSSDGQQIFDILAIALNILTYGIGAAATLGIVISSIQYITARDNAGQVEKAKNRIFQIVIGIAIYAVFWGVLNFLLPGGLFAQTNP